MKTRDFLKIVNNPDFDLNALTYLVENYKKLGFSRSDVRKIVNLYEMNVMKKVGILERNMSHAELQKIKEKYGVSQLFVKQGKNIDQQLQIGDFIYSFNVKEKVKSLR